MENDGKAVFMDAALGNLCFIPQSSSTSSRDYEDYMRRLRKVDPECAKIANGDKIKFSMSDIKERSNRKTRILKKFFSQL